MTELYEKSLRTLEFPRVLEMLAGQCATQEAKDRAMKLRPSTEEREVQRLMDEGASTEFLLGLGLEYRFITQYLIGEISDRDDMLAQLAHAIKKFAKRQMTWFRRNPNIVWLDMQGDAYAQACEAVEAFLKK